MSALLRIALRVRNVRRLYDLPHHCRSEAWTSVLYCRVVPFLHHVRLNSSVRRNVTRRSHQPLRMNAVYYPRLHLRHLRIELAHIRRHRDVLSLLELLNVYHRNDNSNDVLHRRLDKQRLDNDLVRRYWILLTTLLDRHTRDR